MTRKHYIMIAKILNEYQDNLESDTEINNFDSMLSQLSGYFKLDNRHFDKQKFIDAVNKS